MSAITNLRISAGKLASPGYNTLVPEREKTECTFIHPWSMESQYQVLRGAGGSRDAKSLTAANSGRGRSEIVSTGSGAEDAAPTWDQVVAEADAEIGKLVAACSNEDEIRAALTTRIDENEKFVETRLRKHGV